MGFDHLSAGYGGVGKYCSYLFSLGVKWLAQFRRLSRDPVMGEVQTTIAITATPPQEREMGQALRLLAENSGKS